MDITPLALTAEEIDDIKAQIADGKAPADYFERHAEAAARNVFGADAKKDPRTGAFIEQGIGSAAQPSANSVAAYETHCRHEPNFIEHLARMKADLAAYQAKRKMSHA